MKYKERFAQDFVYSIKDLQDGEAVNCFKSYLAGFDKARSIAARGFENQMYSHIINLCEDEMENEDSNFDPH